MRTMLSRPKSRSKSRSRSRSISKGKSKKKLLFNMSRKLSPRQRQKSRVGARSHNTLLTNSMKVEWSTPIQSRKTSVRMLEMRTIIRLHNQPVDWYPGMSLFLEVLVIFCHSAFEIPSLG